MFQVLAVGAVILAVNISAYAQPAVSYSYDAQGRPSTASSTLGQTSTLAYDPLGRVAAQTLPQGAVGFEYNGQDAVTSVTDPRGLTTGYSRDSFAQVFGQLSPDTGQQAAVFDEDGNLTKLTLADFSSINFSYDLLNRLTSISSPGFAAGLSYDAGGKNGKLTGATFPAGTATWTWDAQGRVASETRSMDGHSFALGMQWQGARLTQLTYPSGRVVTFTLGQGQVRAISVDGTPVITGISYQAFGPVAGWTMGGAGTYSRTYDLHGRVTEVSDGVGQRTLTWDDDNRLTQVARGGVPLAAYGYDSMSRVTSATEGGVSRTFAYDINGNRTSQVVGSATYPLTVSPTSNRLTSAQAPGQALGNYQYDSNGNVTSDGARVVLRWNAMGFAKQAVVAGANTDYQYDVFGQRVKKSGPAGTRYYVYAQDQVSLLGEYDANGTALTEYVYLDGVPVLALKAGSIAYLIPDHLGTPRVAKNASGALVWQWESDAFGNGAANEDPSGLGNFAVSLRFPGQVYDPETGLHYNNARYYDPSTGRYRSSDPIGLAGGLNTYLYANGRASLEVDPSGLAPNFNDFNPNQNGPAQASNMYMRAQRNIQLEKGVFSVASHANNLEMVGPNKERFNAKQYAERLRANGYTEGLTVKLYSCLSGLGQASGGPSFAQLLANELGVPVIAATTYMMYGENRAPAPFDTPKQYDEGSKLTHAYANFMRMKKFYPEKDGK